MDSEQHIKDFEYQFKCPCVITLSGNNSSGKSTLLTKLLTRSDEIFDKNIDKVLI